MMKTTFTITECLAKRGCYTREMIADITRNQSQITLSFIINHPDLKLTEKAWWIVNNTELTPDQLSNFAQCAAHLATEGFPEFIDQAIVISELIPQALNYASKETRQNAYAVYSATTRDPQDRVFSACKYLEMTNNTEKIIDFFNKFFA